MVTISTTDKFLGSLMGAYIGHYYSEQSAHHQEQWPPVESSPLYQAWLASLQQQQILAPNSAITNVAVALPWLLYHHDDRHHRHRRLTQNNDIDTNATGTVDTLGTLYILGDCLEWLMQCSLNAQYPHLRLCEHLRQKSSTYPSNIKPSVQWVIEILTTPASDISPQRKSYKQPWWAVTSALRYCFIYRENMALALASPDIVAPIPSMVGCLLGAWRGPSVIPTAWRMALLPDSRQSLSDITQQLYRRWAGISNLTANCAVFPLDL